MPCKNKKKKHRRWLTPALALCALSLASCEAASALIPIAKPAVDRGIQVIQNPAVADANQDGKTSWGERIAFILGLGGVAGAAYLKAHGAQKEVDQQWDKQMAAAEAAKKPT